MLPGSRTSLRDETEYLTFSPGAKGLHHLHSHRAATNVPEFGAFALDLQPVHSVAAQRSNKTDRAANSQTYGILSLLTVAALWGTYSPVLKFLFSQPYPPTAAFMTAAQALLAAVFLLASTLGSSSSSTLLSASPPSISLTAVSPAAAATAAVVRSKLTAAPRRTLLSTSASPHGLSQQVALQLRLAGRLVYVLITAATTYWFRRRLVASEVASEGEAGAVECSGSNSLNSWSRSSSSKLTQLWRTWGKVSRSSSSRRGGSGGGSGAQRNEELLPLLSGRRSPTLIPPSSGPSSGLQQRSFIDSNEQQQQQQQQQGAESMGVHGGSGVESGEQQPVGATSSSSILDAAVMSPLGKSPSPNLMRAGGCLQACRETEEVLVAESCVATGLMEGGGTCEGSLPGSARSSSGGGGVGGGKMLGLQSHNLLAVPLGSLLAVGLELGTYSFCAAALGTWGLQRVSATKAAFLGQATSLITPLLVALSGQRVAPAVWGACGVGVLGATLVAMDGASRAALSTSLYSSATNAEVVTAAGETTLRSAAAAAAGLGTAGGGSLGSVSRSMRLEADEGIWIPASAAAAAGAHPVPLSEMGRMNSLPPALSPESLGAQYILASCLFYALGTVRLGVHSGRFAPLQLAAASAVVYAGLAAIWLAVEVLGTPPGVRSPLAVVGTLMRDNAALALVLWAGLGPGALSSYLQVLGQRIVPAAQAQMLYSSSPFWSAIISRVLLRGRDGTMGPLAWLGGSVMLSASLLASLLGGVRRKKAATGPVTTGPLPFGKAGPGMNGAAVMGATSHRGMVGVDAGGGSVSCASSGQAWSGDGVAGGHRDL